MGFGAIPTIDRIEVTTRTGADGTNGRVYLGIGGREFCLQTPRNDFRRNRVDSFILGEGSNVKNSEQNDPRALMPLASQDLDAFPVYLRYDGLGSWALEGIAITARSGSSAAAGFARSGSVALGSATGRRVFLRQATVSSYQGTASLQIENIEDFPGLGNPLVGSFVSTLVFTVTQVEALLDDITIVIVTVSQQGEAVGTFDQAAGRIDLTMSLRIHFPPGVPFRDSEVTIAFTTESVTGQVVGQELIGQRLQQNTGLLRLVGTSRFHGGTADGRAVDAVLTGTVNPVPL